MTWRAALWYHWLFKNAKSATDFIYHHMKTDSSFWNLSELILSQFWCCNILHVKYVIFHFVTGVVINSKHATTATNVVHETRRNTWRLGCQPAAFIRTYLWPCPSRELLEIFPLVYRSRTAKSSRKTIYTVQVPSSCLGSNPAVRTYLTARRWVLGDQRAADFPLWGREAGHFTWTATLTW